MEYSKMADIIYKVNEHVQSLEFNYFYFLLGSREGEPNKHCDKPLNGRLPFIYSIFLLIQFTKPSEK